MRRQCCQAARFGAWIKHSGINRNPFIETFFHLKNKNYGNVSKGANGTFSGKVGSVIGSNWRSIDYMKGLSKKNSKPSTEGTQF
ncbi:DUF6266 family protein [Pedobacter sp. WC2501]|uniref:DUF6266 family protein n=1 Tax=Pedobacter sp. WC2501 TaxID=3461400 RepID=UPI004046162F